MKRVLSKSIQVIAWFDCEGKVKPIKFKYKEQDEENKVVIINRVIDRQLEKLAGNLMWKFTCVSIIDGVERRYNIKYDLLESKWFLFI